MTRTFEMIAAARLMSAGGRIQTGDLKELGKEQMQMYRHAAKEKNAEKVRKRHHHLRGTTKKDSLDDEGTEFALRSMGVEMADDDERTAAVDSRGKSSGKGGKVAPKAFKGGRRNSQAPPGRNALAEALAQELEEERRARRLLDGGGVAPAQEDEEDEESDDDKKGGEPNATDGAGEGAAEAGAVIDGGSAFGLGF